jgi:glycosyltransferase involved in cell wall biosynthesis
MLAFCVLRVWKVILEQNSFNLQGLARKAAEERFSGNNDGNFRLRLREGLGRPPRNYFTLDSNLATGQMPYAMSMRFSMPGPFAPGIRMPPSQLIYAKKCILPSKAAHVLQSLNMAYAFAEQGVPTVMWPGFKESGHESFRDRMERDYGLFKSPQLYLRALIGRHKGFYGMNFRLRLLYAWLRAPKGTVFYARDITEALTLARFKRWLPMPRPFFFEIHELLKEQHHALNTGRSEHLGRMEAEVLASVDGVVCISPVLVDRLASVYGYKRPLLVSPMGFNHRLFEFIPDVNFSGKITIVYVGSLYKGKGIHNLVRALDLLPDRFCLKVIGGNPGYELEDLKNIVKNMSIDSKRVVFYGHVPQSKIYSCIKDASVMVIPQDSDVEYFSPIKLYEAIGMGMPLVTTPVPAIKSVLNHEVDSIIARSSSPADIADAVLEMVSDQVRARQMQRRCRELSGSLAWSARAKMCLDFIDDVAN